MKYLLLLLFFVHQTHAFTLSESKGRGFSSNEIDIHIASTSCAGAGFSTTELRTMVKNAVDDYWNKVPTSALYLDVKDIEPSFNLDGETHSSALSTFVPEGSIVAGCNDDFTDASILGGAVIDCDGGCKAVLILNANNSNLQTKSSSEIEAVIAHEIGHAFGLGHSEYEFNLMWFSTGQKTQKWLGQDDIDGVSYLYPHKEEFPLLGFCGSIDLDDDNQFSGSFMISLFFMLILGSIIKKSFRIFTLSIRHT